MLAVDFLLDGLELAQQGAVTHYFLEVLLYLAVAKLLLDDTPTEQALALVAKRGELGWELCAVFLYKLIGLEPAQDFDGAENGSGVVLSLGHFDASRLVETLVTREPQKKKGTARRSKLN